ncbi:uncharacterized protein LOC134235657 [Saccostrea cucullata]|uniref:uncharacterized protein LOC134235657 n=1 Tax=Saccostrea cuccullata TaxID=36930 RepID=UPI002ED5AFDB
MRFCLKTSSGYQLMDLEANVTVPSSESRANSCVMSRTIIASIQVLDAGQVYCDVYNATASSTCNTHLVSEDKVFSVQDFPVCNESTTTTLRLSTKQTSAVTQSPEVTTNGVIIQANQDALVHSDLGGECILKCHTSGVWLYVDY